MSEYTPTTEKIRDDFSRFVSDYRIWRSSESKIRRYNYRKRQFTRWLQEERARIWDECGESFIGQGYEDSETYLRNPYRGEV